MQSAWAARVLVLEVASLRGSRRPASVVEDVVGRMRHRHRTGRRRWTPAEIRTSSPHGASAAAPRLRGTRPPGGVGRRAGVRGSSGNRRHGLPRRPPSTPRTPCGSTGGSQLWPRASTTLNGHCDQKRADLLADVLLDARAAAPQRQSPRFRLAQPDIRGSGSPDLGDVPRRRPTIRAPRSAWWSGWTPSSGWRTGPRRCPAWARSPPTSPATWPPTAHGGPGSPTPVTGSVVATGSRRYSPSASARPPGPRPGAGLPDARVAGGRRSACDLDHTIPWPRGQTSATKSRAPVPTTPPAQDAHAGWDLHHRLTTDGAGACPAG